MRTGNTLDKDLESALKALEQSKAASELAYVEVIISCNRKNLERELQNKGRQQNKMQSRGKRREEELK